MRSGGNCVRMMVRIDYLRREWCNDVEYVSENLVAVYSSFYYLKVNPNNNQLEIHFNSWR